MDLHSPEVNATLHVKKERMETNGEGGVETQGPARIEAQPTLTVFDCNPNLTVDVWKEFVPIGRGEDGREKGRCVHCSSILVIEKRLGTSTLRRHVKSCQRKLKNKSGDNDVLNKPACNDKKQNPINVVERASVSKSSNVQSKKRQCGSVSRGKKTRSGMLLGLDMLDCPVCFEALSTPIFQCGNGHLACSSCCPKLNNKCTTCASPIGNIRCRAMESVVESVFVPCQNAKLGCTKNLSYGKESAHEKECTFSQCSCPALDCSYIGSYSNIYSHFVDEHRHTSKSVSFVCGGSVDVQMNIAIDKILVLWECEKRLLFALQCFSEAQGVYVTVRCIAPSAAPEVEKFAYRLFYSMDGHDLTYKSPEVKRVLEANSQTPQDNFMFVPHCLLRGELLEIKLCIGSQCREVKQEKLIETTQSQETVQGYFQFIHAEKDAMCQAEMRTIGEGSRFEFGSIDVDASQKELDLVNIKIEMLE